MAFKVKFMDTMVEINFREFLKREVKNLRTQYKTLLTKKQGVLEDPAPHNTPSTIARKGKDHWMKDTGELSDNGFVIESTDMMLRISASTAPHSGRSTYMGVPGGHAGQKPGVRRPRTEKRAHISKKPVTYEQLFSWHNKGYSGIFNGFPNKSGFEIRQQKEFLRQIKEQTGNIKDRTIKLKG